MAATGSPPSLISLSLSLRVTYNWRKEHRDRILKCKWEREREDRSVRYEYFAFVVIVGGMSMQTVQHLQRNVCMTPAQFTASCNSTTSPGQTSQPTESKDEPYSIKEAMANAQQLLSVARQLLPPLKALVEQWTAEVDVNHVSCRVESPSVLLQHAFLDKVGDIPR